MAFPVGRSVAEDPAKHLRAKAIASDIARRHGINPQVADERDPELLQSAADTIERQGYSRGSGLSGFRNRDEYLAERQRLIDARNRIARSKTGNPKPALTHGPEADTVLDPRTYEYMQGYGRDADFLRGLASHYEAYPDARMPANGLPPSEGLSSALKYWDSSNNARSAGNDLLDSNYARNGGVTYLLGQLTNTDHPVGYAFSTYNIVPNALKVMGNGDTSNPLRALATGQAMERFTQLHRTNPTNLSPVLDLPPHASAAAVDASAGRLAQEAPAAYAPSADERWHHNGWGTRDPGPAIRLLSDLLFDAVDPDFALTAAKSLMSAGRTAGHLARSHLNNVAVDAATTAPFYDPASHAPNADRHDEYQAARNYMTGNYGAGSLLGFGP